MDVAAAAEMPRAVFEAQLSGWVKDLLTETKIQLNFVEQRELVEILIADMLGLGPLEPLIEDETVTDIMVNGAKQVYVERRGKLELTDVRFRDDDHVMNVATKIVTRIGRRIDESQPLVDARLADGSRVNIITPPLAIDGPSISIRKFSKKTITLDTMARQANISPQMATLLKIAARCRLNILISGGTGSGKTTLLNAMSRLIDPAERTVTIEDAAELQLQQPHVVRLETRPPNLEGTGEITMRDLLRNALRMRPDRIILGEIRGAEALDVLQAMNTGHDGSMSTIHANSPREALTRLENMVGMTGINLPSKAVRTQIAAAVHLIAQVNRMRDGIRRVTHVMEVVGMEGDTITTQELFSFQFQGETTEGMLRGTFKSNGIRPNFLHARRVLRPRSAASRGYLRHGTGARSGNLDRGHLRDRRRVDVWPHRAGVERQRGQPALQPACQYDARPGAGGPPLWRRPPLDRCRGSGAHRQSIAWLGTWLPRRDLLVARLARTGRAISIGQYAMACAGLTVLAAIGLAVAVADRHRAEPAARIADRNGPSSPGHRTHGKASPGRLHRSVPGRNRSDRAGAALGPAGQRGDRRSRP